MDILDSEFSKGIGYPETCSRSSGATEKIKRNKIQKGFLNIKLPVKMRKTKDIWICQNKKYNLNGYGFSKKEAIDMFKFSVEEYLKYSAPKEYEILFTQDKRGKIKSGSSTK